jgi:hypothetical protein
MNRPRLSLTLLLVCGTLAACTGVIAPSGAGTGTGSTTGTGTGSTTGSGTGSSTGSGTGSSTGSGGTGSPTGSGGSVGTGSGGSGAGNSGVGGAAPLPVVLDGQPVNSRFVRLTNEQWENTVRDLLQLTAPTGMSSTFEGAPPGGNFPNNEKGLFITGNLWTSYEASAEALSQKVARDATALAKITGGTTVAATFIQTFGRRAYRRDLTAAEVTTYTTLFNSAAAIFNSGNAFADGAQLVIETMLKSPHFLYRSELTPAGQPLSGYEVASKLSYLLRNTMPDNALLDAAKATLSTPDQIAAQAQTMLGTAQAKTAFQGFHAQLLGIGRYNNIEKDPALKFTPAMATDLQTADTMFFDYLYDQNLGFKDLLLSPVAFVNQAIAPLYGMTATGTAFKQVQLGSERPGYFTRAGFLAVNGTLKDPDPILRGVNIIRRVMGNSNFAPPPGVDIPPVPTAKPGQTNRERVTAHTGFGTCGGSCHGNYINPLGFAFENLDTMGQLRTMDNGKPIDTTGTFPFVDGTKSFMDAPTLLALIATDSQAYLTYGVHMAEFILARDIAEKDRPFMTTLTQMNMNAASIKQLALAIMKSDAFTKRGTP